ncbi:hypothetical protein J2W34_006523 [Variovorax boronicumulans]|nr:hypothetical protein [Variovorax boronicumulans]
MRSWRRFSRASSSSSAFPIVIRVTLVYFTCSARSKSSSASGRSSWSSSWRGVVGGGSALVYAESRNYTELLFVFVVMVIAASRPVLRTVMSLVNAVARIVPVRTPLATAWLGLAAVPLLGSLITEPAAMTIAALMLAPQIFRPDVPERVS